MRVGFFTAWRFASFAFVVFLLVALLLAVVMAGRPVSPVAEPDPVWAGYRIRDWPWAPAGDGVFTQLGPLNYVQAGRGHADRQGAFALTVIILTATLYAYTTARSARARDRPGRPGRERRPRAHTNAGGMTYMGRYLIRLDHGQYVLH